MTDRQTLAVIIPVYNGAKYLETSVKSVLTQPCPNVHVVIVNDGSTDNSLEIANSISTKDSRVTVLTQSNRGVSAARNHGIEHCIEKKYQYIAFLDSDDIWVNGFYTDELQKQIFAENRSAYQFSMYFGNNNLTRVNTLYGKDELKAGRSVRFGQHFCSFIYSAEILRTYNIRFPEGIRVQEDEVFRYLFMTFCDSVRSFRFPIFVYRSNVKSVLHQKFDVTKRYFGDIIPAWTWCKNELEKLHTQNNKITVADIGGCSTMCKTFLAEYIASACEQGLSVKYIFEQISKPEYASLYSNPDIWVDSKSLKLWTDFFNKPRRIWIKYRIKGIVIRIAKVLRNTPLVQFKRYPEKFYNE